MQTIYELQREYPLATQRAIQNFGSQARTVSQLIEELLTDDVDENELEQSIYDEIINQLQP